MYELMKAQAFIINRQRQEAKWILDDFKHSNPDKKGSNLGLLSVSDDAVRERAFIR